MEEKQVYRIELPDNSTYYIDYYTDTNEAEFEGHKTIIGHERFLDFILTAQVLGIEVRKV